MKDRRTEKITKREESLTVSLKAKDRSRGLGRLKKRGQWESYPEKNQVRVKLI